MNLTEAILKQRADMIERLREELRQAGVEVGDSSRGIAVRHIPDVDEFSRAVRCTGRSVDWDESRGWHFWRED